MAREALDILCDMNDRNAKRQVLAAIGIMTGLCRVSVQPKRDTRSNRQNAFYWAGVVAPFARYLSSQDYNVTTDEEAHEFLKGKFLPVQVTNKSTGEVIGQRVRSTTQLTTEEMSVYIERCRAWLLDFFGIVTFDPDEISTGRMASPVHAIA